MPENIEHKLQVGVGFKVEDTNGGISDLATHAEKINQAMSSLATTMSKVENGFKQTGNVGKQTEKTYTNLQTIMNKYKAGLIDDAEAMKQLRAEQEKLNKELNKVDEGSKKYQGLLEQLAKVSKEYNKLSDAETKAIEKMLKEEEKAMAKSAEEKYKQAVEMNKAETKAFDEEQKLRMKSASESADFFKELYRQQEQVVRQELAKTTSSYKQAMNDRKASSKMLGNMLEPVDTNFSSNLFNSAVKWSGAYAIIREFTNIGKSIVDIEYNTINNQRLMGNFSAELRDSLNASAADIARNTGILITDAQEIQGAWVRINEQYAKSPELLGEMAEITSKFMNVGEIENAEDAVKLLNSTLLQFDLTGENVIQNAEEIANKFAYMADVTAMGTADEYAEGIAKMGANIKNMNGDVDDAIVLLSLVGDKLAKNGVEAGNALNTFSAYMHRDKTLNLFDKLAVQLDDANIRIREGEKGLKNYEETIKTIASAYSQLKTQGDQQGMNEIIEALGATRQRATAQAVLEAIASDGGQNLEYYYNLLRNATAEGNYLEEQNEILMASMKNQYNSLATTIQEAGMTIANAGTLDILTALMSGFEGFLTLVKSIPQPIISGITALTAYKVALGGLEKIGDITGYTDKLAQSLQFGSEEQVKAANATRQNTDAFLDYQRVLYNTVPASERTAESYRLQMDALTEYEQTVASYNISLANGSKTIDEYNQEMAKAQQTYLGTIDTVAQATVGTKEYTNATNISANATRRATMLKQQEDTQNKKSLVTLLAENGYKKAKLVLENTLNGVRKVGMALTTQSNAATIAGTVADKAAAVGKTLLTGATTALGVALNFLLSPMTLVTVAIGGLSWLFSQGKDKVEKYKEEMEKLKSSVSETTSRLEELRAKQSEGTLSGTEEEELAYLEKKLELEKELLKTKQQEVANEEYDDTSDSIRDSIGNYRTAQYRNAAYTNQLSDVGKYGVDEIETTEKLTEANKDLSKSALELANYYEYLKFNIENGTWSKEALEQANKDLAELEKLMPEVEQLNAELTEVNTTASLLDDESIQSFNDGISESLVGINKVDEDIQKLIDGASSNELMGIIEDYPEFANVIGKSTAEQIAYLRSLQTESGSALLEELDSKIEELNDAKTQLETEIASIDQEENLDEYTQKNEQLQKTIDLLNEVQAKKDIVINVTTKLDQFNLGDVMNQMDGLVSSTKSLVEAQNQLAQGTALSKQALWELAMQYPEMLYQANLFNDGSVEGVKAAVDATLDMYNQQHNNAIDLKIQELEAERDFIQGILDLEQQKLDILTKGTVENANGELEVKGDLATMLGEYNDVIGDQHTLAEQYKVDKSVEAASAQAQAQDEASAKIVSYSADTGEKVAANVTEGTAAGVEGASRNAGLLGSVFEKIKGWASNLATWVAKAFTGDESGAGAVSGDGIVGDRTNTFTRATYNKHDNTIDGKTVSEWVKTQKEVLKLNVDTYKVSLQGLNNAITNLEGFKEQGLKGVSNNYSSNGAGGKGGSSGGNSSGGSGKSDAEKAAEEATKAAEEAIKAIEKFTEEYIKNVESMQDRIAKALKKKYQEQYDERKKLLEKEHNERVAQIQAEIDKINGDRPEDKKTRLKGLKEQLELWKQDNSTLGKAKQKELSDQITELNKEIKIDELEAKLDKENEHYNNLIDSDSEFYDKTLAKLEAMMSDEHVYKEANKLIENNKQQEIIDLLTEYDEKWDGWGTLMGKTAGEIIAEEVALAIANYKDVKNGTITKDGGKNTNKVTNGSNGGSSGTKTTTKTTISKNPTTSANKPIKTGGKVRIKDTNAKMYYTSDSSSSVGTWGGYSGNYYVVNTNGNRAALSKTNNINGAIGWIDKKQLVGLASGGYTGNSEGLAMLHKKERVLDARQTSAFENLIYDFLPQISSHLLNPNNNTYNNGNNVTFNKELVRVDIGTVVNNKQFDVDNGIDNLDRAFRQSLRKSGLNLKR